MTITRFTLAFVIAHCTLACTPEACLRRSDCTKGLMCVAGECVGQTDTESASSTTGGSETTSTNTTAMPTSEGTTETMESETDTSESSGDTAGESEAP